MNKLIRTLQPVVIYKEHSLKSKKIRETTENEYLKLKRIKLREKKRWYEVILENESLGYIEKDNSKVFKCAYVELEDDECHGFNYSLKTEENLSFEQIFFPERDKVELKNPEDISTLKSVSVKQTKDLEKNKTRFVELYYDSEIVEVDKFIVKKKDRFHLTFEPEYPSKDVFIQINNFKDKSGYLLKKTNHGLVSDKWMTYLSYVILAVCTIATFLGCLAAGWLVIGFVLIIPGLIVGFLVMFALQIAISILKGIFNEIYVRL